MAYQYLSIYDSCRLDLCVTPKKNHLTEFFHVDYYFNCEETIIRIMGQSEALY